MSLLDADVFADRGYAWAVDTSPYKFFHTIAINQKTLPKGIFVHPTINYD